MLSAVVGVTDQRWFDFLASRAVNGRLDEVNFWRPLAQSGDPSAQYRLGVMYAEGKGVASNDAEAALWFERAAEQGEPMAQYNLGASYVEGTGVRKDLVTAATAGCTALQGLW